MPNVSRIFKKVFTPVTIMIVPHSRTKSYGLRIPAAAVFLSMVAFVLGAAYMVAVSIHTMDYYRMRDRLTVLSHRLDDLNETMDSLKAAEEQFRRLFSLKSKKEVIETFRFDDTGSLNMEALKKQIEASMRSVADIRTYIAQQKDLYLATPSGWPVRGPISSPYGPREAPTAGARTFHTGIDISVPSGSPVTATADGIVSYSGSSAGGGNTVVVEHGHGFSTAYAHNRKNVVRVGQRVKRGDVLALSGSTGVSTGPHVHYEIWRNGHHVNPGDKLARS